MTTIFQRHAGAEFARFARERMVREQESRRDAETAEAFRAMVEDVSPDHMPNSLDAPCDTFQQTRNAGWAGYCAHCGWSVEFHVTQEGTDARSATATPGSGQRLPLGTRVRHTLTGGHGTVVSDGYIGNLYGPQVLVRSDATGRTWGWFVDETETF